MPFPDVTGWGGPEQYDYGADPYQAERDAQAVQLGLPTGLSANDYYAAFQQLMASPEWASLQAGRTAQIDQESAARLSQYEEDKSDRRNRFLAGSALAIGTAGLATGAFGALGGAGGATTGGYGGAATTYPLASGGAITGSAIPGVTSATTAAAAAGGLAPAIGGAAAAGGSFLDNWLPTIGSGVNALLGYNAAGNAADAEAEAYQQAIAEQRRQYDTTRADLQPWMQAGQGALNNLQNPSTAFQASPGYEWARNEGQRDIGNSFAARGGAASGNALKALSEFQTGLAQQDYGNWWNQQAGLAGVGQTATTNVGAFGQNSAGNVGNYLANQGASRASGVMNRGAILGGAVNDTLSNVSNYLYRRRAA
jgi:hypothetical protein